MMSCTPSNLAGTTVEFAAVVFFLGAGAYSEMSRFKTGGRLTAMGQHVTFFEAFVCAHPCVSSLSIWMPIHASGYQSSDPMRLEVKIPIIMSCWSWSLQLVYFVNQYAQQFFGDFWVVGIVVGAHVVVVIISDYKLLFVLLSRTPRTRVVVMEEEEEEESPQEQFQITILASRPKSLEHFHCITILNTTLRQVGPCTFSKIRYLHSWSARPIFQDNWWFRIRSSRYLWQKRDPRKEFIKLTVVEINKL
jgi:hypothetical protein